MSTRSNINVKVKPSDYGKTFQHQGDPKYFGEVKIPGENPEDIYLSIYHHNDGYPSRLGETLLNRYNNYEDAMNAVLGGDASSLLDGKEDYYSKGLGERFEDNRPSITTTPKSYNEYTYKFEDGEWWFTNGEDRKGDGVWRKLTDIANLDETGQYHITNDFF